MIFRRMIIATVSVVLLVFAVLWYVEPKTAVNSLLYVSPVLLLMAFFLKKALDHGTDLTRQLEEGLRATLSSLDLEYLYINKKLLYAIGTFEGYQICFKYGMISENDWTNVSGALSKMAIMARFKIPGTENTAFHCAVLPPELSSATRSMYSWQNPEPGFYVGRAKSQNDEKAMRQFERLSEDTKQALRALTSVFGGSCGISTDWETVTVGKDEALKLAGNDPLKLTQLDFQVKIPFMTGADELDSFLKSASKTAALLSRDLGPKGKRPKESSSVN
ncbi:MAG: hypothetical protein ABFD04_12055 [Syntrophomonas sp.]